MGRSAEAIALLEHGAKVNPLSRASRVPVRSRTLLRAQVRRGSFARFQRAIELEPQNVGAFGLLAQVYGKMGRAPEAVDPCSTVRSSAGPRRWGSPTHWPGGVPRRWRWLRGLTKPGSNTDNMGLARIYLVLGDKDRGFEWLTKAFDARHNLAATTKFSPLFDDVRSDPRFQALVARLKIPD